MAKQKNNEKPRIIVSDFDGTLTKKDTFLEFIRYTRGTRDFAMGFLRYLPLIVMMKLRLYPNWKTKQKVFSHFFKGMTVEDFNRRCVEFADKNRHMLRPEGIRMIEKEMEEGSEVVIVSASVENWVRPFFPSTTILCTQVEENDGRLTGRFLSKNCYGAEKVQRLREVYPERSLLYVVAYGDSRGDKEMLDFADEGHFKPFRTK